MVTLPRPPILTPLPYLVTKHNHRHALGCYSQLYDHIFTALEGDPEVGVTWE